MNDLATHPLQGIELFSGVGMLGEGLRAGLAYLGVPYRAVCHVEREAHAASVMVARMEEGSMDAAPVWSDVCTFDARAWRGKVDCIVAGFPCQDLSVAGKRAGLDGHRSGLFFEVVRIADDCGAWLILLENVAGIASATAAVMDAEEGELDERAAARVLGELADSGWNAEWITLSASDVGASHGRARWFCLAWKLGNAEGVRNGSWGMPVRNGPDIAFSSRSVQHVDDAECTEWWPARPGSTGRQQGNDGRRTEAHGRAGVAEQVLGDAGLQHGVVQQRRFRPEHPRAGDELADAGRIHARRGEHVAWPGRQQAEHNPCCCAMADAGDAGSQGGELGRALPGNGGGQEAHGSTGELRGLFAPGPDDPRWSRILADHPELAPALEPAFRGMANGLAFDMGDSRAARLKCIGNGVVALCAATAVVVLLRRAGIMTSEMAIRRAA